MSLYRTLGALFLYPLSQALRKSSQEISEAEESQIIPFITPALRANVTHILDDDSDTVYFASTAFVVTLNLVERVLLWATYARTMVFSNSRTVE
jgi:hypothetical protein